MKKIIFFSDQYHVFSPKAQELEEFFGDAEIDVFIKHEDVFEEIESIPGNEGYILVLDSLLPGQTVEDIFAGLKYFLHELQSLEKRIADKAKKSGSDSIENRAKIIVFSPTITEKQVDYDFFAQINSLDKDADDLLFEALEKAIK